MRDLILSAGHSNNPNGDRGNASLGRYEGDLTIELRDLIVSELSKIGVSARTDDNKNALKESLAYFKSFINGKTVAIDIHFNAYNGTATGCEVIVPKDATTFEKNLSQELLDAICKTTLLKSRGVKSEAETARKSLGWMKQGCEESLIEVAFMDNKSDMLLYNANKSAIAIKIAQVIKKYLCL